MKDKSYAKINLSLDVKAKRNDGYHELNSIMIPVDFYDVLEITKDDNTSYSCNEDIVFDEHNTIVKAIKYIKDKYNVKDEFKVILEKNIPSQAGLGGGSANAASAIRILNEMYNLNMNDKEIIEACLYIGADVPFTYFNKPAQVEGIGEKLTFLNVKKNMYVLLVKPEKGVSTKWAYESLDIDKADHPNIEAIKERLASGEEYSFLLANSLEEPALRICEDIKKIKERLKSLKIEYPLMSGSGSTVFAISEDCELLKKIKEEIQEDYSFVCLTKFKI